jgi:hypothetical protein
MKDDSHLSFNQFCQIIDKTDYAKKRFEGERPGLRDVYDGCKKQYGRVTQSHADLISRAIEAQNVELEW